jgi:hypothetical protein
VTKEREAWSLRGSSAGPTVAASCLAALSLLPCMESQCHSSPLRLRQAFGSGFTGDSKPLVAGA